MFKPHKLRSLRSWRLQNLEFATSLPAVYKTRFWVSIGKWRQYLPPLSVFWPWTEQYPTAAIIQTHWTFSLVDKLNIPPLKWTFLLQQGGAPSSCDVLHVHTFRCMCILNVRWDHSATSRAEWCLLSKARGIGCQRSSLREFVAVFRPIK